MVKSMVKSNKKEIKKLDIGSSFLFLIFIYKLYNYI
jgi:hypothetical protein